MRSSPSISSASNSTDPRRGDLRAFLDALGLGNYAKVLEREEIDFDALVLLTDDDLAAVGLPMGPRRKILRALELTEAPGADNPDPAAAPAAERRQLTVAFCDMVGSTALSRALDVEDMRDVLLRYQDLVAGVVARSGGHIAGFQGDGIKIYFGFPNAHEDGAARAVRAALEISSGVGGIRAPNDARLAVRIGIATGVVVVGDLIGEGAAQEETVIGDTPNLAGRLQSFADAGGVLISGTTRKLVGDLFDIEAMPAQAFKGFEELEDAYRVLGERKVESRFDALKGPSRMGIVGRNDDVAALLDAWRSACNGRGRTVILQGEAGIGKSRTAEAFFTTIAKEGQRLSFQCWPHLSNSTFHPFLDVFEGLAASEGRLMPRLGGDETDAIEDYGSDALALAGARRQDAHQAKEAFSRELTGYLAEKSLKSPLLVHVEDLHWADQSSLDFIAGLVDAIAERRILLLLSARPEFQGLAETAAPVRSITLGRLSRAASLALIDVTAPGQPLSPKTRETIAERTDGIPLFIEELTKAVLEIADRNEGVLATGERRSEAPLIPLTLYDSLLTRLDRLGPAKTVAQRASAIGREFSREMLGAVSLLDPDATDQALLALEEAGIVHRVPGEERRYAFKHALVQDAAYQSILTKERRAVHSAISDILIADHVEVAARRPELLAHHLSEAGRTAEAIPHWQAAGRRAAEISSYIEASNHLGRALLLHRALPETERDRTRELDLLMALAPVHLATEGYGAVSIVGLFDDAKALCHALGDHERLLTVLFGEWAISSHRRSIGEVVALARAIRRTARHHDDISLRLMGSRALGNSLLFAGRARQARIYLRHAVDNYDEARDRELARTFGLDLKTSALSQLVMADWILGERQAARQHGAEAIARAEALDHGNSLAHAIIHGGLFLNQFDERPDRVIEHAERLHLMAEAGGFSMFVAWADTMAGWADAQLGDAQGGIAKMNDGLARATAVGTRLYRPYFLTLLADCHKREGNLEAAAEAASEAATLVRSRGEGWYRSGVERILRETAR